MNYPACREIQRKFRILSRALCPRGITLVAPLVTIVARFLCQYCVTIMYDDKVNLTRKVYYIHGDDSRNNGSWGRMNDRIENIRLSTTTDRPISNIRNTKCFLNSLVQVLLRYRSMAFSNVWYFLKFLEFFVHSLDGRPFVCSWK